jgi:hypothetical protein
VIIDGTTGHFLDYITYLPKDNNITEVEIQNEKIFELLSKKWTISKVGYVRDQNTGEIVRLEVYLKKEGTSESLYN